MHESFTGFVKMLFISTKFISAAIPTTLFRIGVDLGKFVEKGNCVASGKSSKIFLPVLRQKLRTSGVVRNFKRGGIISTFFQAFFFFFSRKN